MSGLKLAREPYYRWLALPVGRRKLARAYLADAVFDAHRDDPEFGHRLLADEARNPGQNGCDRTGRICRDQHWWSTSGKKRGKNGKKPGLPGLTTTGAAETSPPNRPNQLLLTDMSEDPSAEYKLYPAAVKGVFPNRIVATRSATG